MTTKETADELRARILAVPRTPKKRRRGRPLGPLTFDLAMKIALRTLELGGKRSHQTQAILEVLEIRPRDAARSRAHDRGKKILKRNPYAKDWARIKHQFAGTPDYQERLFQMFRDQVAEHEGCSRFQHELEAELKEIDRRLSNVPEERRGPLERIKIGDLLELLRVNSIDGTFRWTYSTSSSVPEFLSPSFFILCPQSSRVS